MPGKAKYIVPSIAQALFVILFLHLSLNVGNNLLNDGDTGYHIRAGDWIVEHLTIPKVDPFSNLTPPPEWTAHEWLSEVIMAQIHRAFGLTGIVLFFTFLISLVYALLFRLLRTYRQNILLDILVIFLVIISAQIHFLARPHIFSLLILVVWYFILDSFQYQDKNYIYMLPPIMLLWVNLHGGYVIGMVLAVIYFSGNVVKSLYSLRNEKEKYLSKAKTIGLVIVACLLVSFINPYGYRIIVFPFKLISDKYLMDHVLEFLSPNFHKFAPYKYILYLVIIILPFSRSRLNFIELALILVFFDMSLYSQRFILIFSIVAAPIIVRQGGEALSHLEGRFAAGIVDRSTNFAAIDASIKGHFWPVVSVVLVVILAVGGSIHFQFDKEKKPVAAVEYLKKEDLKGNMFNNDEFGDYVIYSAFPQYRVFIDGRLDMYGTNRIKEYFKIMGFSSEMPSILEKHKIGWMLIESDSPLSRYLFNSRDWKLIYSDKVASIFVRYIPEYQDVIRKYPDIKLHAVKEEKTETI